MTERIYNFSAGPAVLPVPVLEQAREEMLSLPGVGMSVMEISHRSKEFDEIIGGAEQNLRDLLGIPEGYRVLFLQGGASLQFSMIPLNLLTDGATADYVITGSWGKKALKEAKKVGAVSVAADLADSRYTRTPEPHELKLDANAAYVHFTSNETIEGVEFKAEPEVGNVPLVCDASSNICSRPVDVSKYVLIYAGAQKNLGPSGVVLAIVRKDLYARIPKSVPGIFNFHKHAEAKSCLNTPPTFAIYMLLETFRWLERQGGIAAMESRNEEKAKLIYDAIDSSQGFYRGTVSDVPNRSRMNLTFRLPTEELTEAFIKQAEKKDMVALKGYRTVGGIRASIYNAMPLAGCQALSGHMQEFARANHGAKA